MPVITLSEGDVKGNTLTFNAKVENAFVAAYLCVAESEATPDATSILSKGRTVKLGEDVVETIYNLQFSTTYNIVLAAMDDDGNIKTANLVMTTGEEPTDVLVAKVDLTHKVFTFKVTPKRGLGLLPPVILCRISLRNMAWPICAARAWLSVLRH